MGRPSATALAPQWGPPDRGWLGAEGYADFAEHDDDARMWAPRPRCGPGHRPLTEVRSIRVNELGLRGFNALKKALALATIAPPLAQVTVQPPETI